MSMYIHITEYMYICMYIGIIYMNIIENGKVNVIFYLLKWEF